MFTNRMTSILILLFVFGSLSTFIVTAAPTVTNSFIQELNVSYTEGIWTCDGVECPAKTFGCRVQRKNNPADNTKLDETSTCFDEQKQSISSSTNTVPMAVARKIDIDVESYIGAVSSYSSGYGMGGLENAEGVIAPNDWEDFKKYAEKNKSMVENSS